MPQAKKKNPQNVGIHTRKKKPPGLMDIWHRKKKIHRTLESTQEKKNRRGSWIFGTVRVERTGQLAEA